MRAVGYTRVSTKMQADDGYSLDGQEREIRARCSANGWEFAELYVESGRSGKSIIGRPELQRLLVAAGRHEFDAVVVLSQDRLGRSTIDLLNIEQELRRLGITLLMIRDAVDTSTPQGRAFFTVRASMAQLERDLISERTKDGYREKASQGYILGRVPIGYRRTEAGDVEVDPVAGPLVREAFLRYATGNYTALQVAEWLNTTGLRSLDGNLFDRHTVSKMLRNPTYIGQVVYRRRSEGNRHVVNGKHAALVDAALWTDVQRAAEENQSSKQPRHPFKRIRYPLSGVAFCGHDDAPMVGSVSAGGSYMRCSTTQRLGRDSCKQRMVRTEVYEDQVADYICHMRLPSKYVGAVTTELRRRRNEAAGTDLDTRRMRNELERWRRLFVLGEISEIEFRRESAVLKKAIAAAERPTEVLDVERAVGYLQNVGALWRTGERETQRGVVQELFSRIVLRDEQVVAITPKAEYEPLFILNHRERFGDVGVVWRPGRDSSTPIYTSTGIPVLVLATAV